MRNCIDDWFKRPIDKLTKEGQEIRVETIPVTINKENKWIETSK
jgi:hypothetical protein